MSTDNQGTEGYIHGYSEVEAARLMSQAEFLAQWVFARVDFSSCSRLLEVGVGVGAETRILLRRFPELAITGVELSEAHLARARETLAEEMAAGRVTLIQASGAALPFEDGRFDGAFICWVLEHVPDAQAVMNEVARVMEPGGRLAVVEVYNASLTIEPRSQVIDDYWVAANAWQRQAGGNPEMGARLPLLAARAGLEIEDFVFMPMVGDARDPALRLGLFRYWAELMRSSEAAVVGSGGFDAARLPALREAFEALEKNPEALFCYTQAQLFARKPLP